MTITSIPQTNKITTKFTRYLNSGFRDHNPSPRCLEKSHISRSRDRNKAVSPWGKRDENWARISAVEACPSTLHCVAMKSLISWSRSLCWPPWRPDACTSLLTSLLLSVMAVLAFLDLILAKSRLDEV